jgi:hypothetical protein
VWLVVGVRSRFVWFDLLAGTGHRHVRALTD